MAGSLFSTLLERGAAVLDRRVGWDKLPLAVAIPVLVGLRDRLRRENLHDTGRGQREVPAVGEHEDYLGSRTTDGMFNDLNEFITALDRERQLHRHRDARHANSRTPAGRL